MSDRPDYCCGACPAVVPQPEHHDCEACRTGYDCACRNNPRCSNSKENDNDWWDLPLHRTEAGYPNCGTCDGGGCPDCTDPA